MVRDDGALPPPCVPLLDGLPVPAGGVWSPLGRRWSHASSIMPISNVWILDYVTFTGLALLDWIPGWFETFTLSLN